MGGGSSELRALKDRLAELESAVEKLERMGVLRGHRLVELEKAVNGHDAAITELQDSQRGYVADLQALEERLDGLEKVLRSAQDDKPTSSRRRDAEARSKKGGD